MKMFFLKLSIAGFVALNVFVFYYASMPSPPATVTLGRLAESSNAYRGTKLVIGNAVGGEKSGRFIVFKTPAKDRHPVVFELKDAADTGDIFSGYCYGVRTDPIEGCPIQPPFIHVGSVTSSR